MFAWESLRGSEKWTGRPLAAHFGIGVRPLQYLFVVGVSNKTLLKELANHGLDLPDRRSDPSRGGTGLLLDYSSKPQV